MKCRERLFLIALTIVIGCLIALSLFNNPIISKIEKSISFPILIFSIVNIATSISDQIVYVCKLKREKEHTGCTPWEYNKAIHEDYLKKYYNETSNGKTDTDEFVEIEREAIQAAERKIKEYTDNIFCYTEIILKMQNCKWIQIVYLLSLVLLIVSMILSEFFCNVVLVIPPTTITFASLFLILIDFVIREPLSGKILEKMFKKEKNKLEKYQNGQDEI